MTKMISKIHSLEVNNLIFFRCGGDGQMKCDPKQCSPEPMLRQMIAAASRRRR